MQIVQHRQQRFLHWGIVVEPQWLLPILKLKVVRLASYMSLLDPHSLTEDSPFGFYHPRKCHWMCCFPCGIILLTLRVPPN